MGHDHAHDDAHPPGHDHVAHSHDALQSGHDQARHDHSGHGHAAHGHAGHSHAPARFDAAFAVGTALNAGFVALQVGFGLAAHSVALLADAVHNLGDVLGLVLAWVAVVLARRAPSARRTYGWGRGTILASLANAVVLLVGIGAISVSAIQHLLAPGAVGSATVMRVAAVGIAVNGTTALMFMRGRHDDLNVRGAFLHMAGDAAVSAGVVLAAGLILLTGATWIDPLASLAIVAVIGWSSWGLLRESMALAMDAVPAGVAPVQVEGFLRTLPGVSEVHDLHIWGLSTTTTALTAHLVCGEAVPLEPDLLIRAACDGLRSRFNIGHCTFQVESSRGAAACTLRPREVV
jgi:cobalt-zinc-cadmium efflux system protein